MAIQVGQVGQPLDSVCTLLAVRTMHTLRFSYGTSERVLGCGRVGYPRAVTEQTIASRVRELAAEAGYDVVANPDLEVPLQVRQAIKKQLGLKTIQNVNSALEHIGRQGGHAAISHEHRCPACLQVLQTQKAKKEVERIQVLKKK